jgi:nucleoside-diphosphate-sugar epimerase
LIVIVGVKNGMQKFLVTGATGFVGSRLVPILIERFGAGSITALVNPQREPEEEASLLQFQRQNVNILQVDLLDLPNNALPVPEFDVVYHLAAYVATERRSPRILVNSVGTGNLLDWLAQSLRGKWLIYTGSIASVDRPYAQGPIVESMPCGPVTDYGRTKLEGEQIIRKRQVELGYDYTILRAPTIVGRGFRAGGMFDRFPQMLQKGSLATRLDWPGRTSFMCVSDVAKILSEVPHVPQTRNEIYMLSNGQDPTFDELLALMARELGVPRKRVVVPRALWKLLGVAATFCAHKLRVPHTLRIFCWRVSLMVFDGFYADASKLNAVLHPHYQSIEEGLRECYEDSSSLA